MRGDLHTINVLRHEGSSPGGLSKNRGREITVTKMVTVRPGYVILSRPATVLSPGKQGRIVRTMRRLQGRGGIAIVLVARCVRRIVSTSRMFMVSRKRIIVRNAPGRVFDQMSRLGGCHVSMPRIAVLTSTLVRGKIPLPGKVLEERRLISTLYRLG